jgi:hypothetical protein
MKEKPNWINKIINILVSIVIIVLLGSNIILFYSIFCTPAKNTYNESDLYDLEALEILYPEIDLSTYSTK